VKWLRRTNWTSFEYRAETLPFQLTCSLKGMYGEVEGTHRNGCVYSAFATRALVHTHLSQSDIPAMHPTLMCLILKRRKSTISLWQFLVLLARTATRTIACSLTKQSMRCGWTSATLATICAPRLRLTMSLPCRLKDIHNRGTVWRRQLYTFVAVHFCLNWRKLSDILGLRAVIIT
jgi:hypothetical protein